ncbi:hypothetical protein SUGI_0942390 [Cryptomeria japonica]|uniref:G-type lectin S-receptor-like serine/threonine-protein kinase At2g19130 n=1 Tax=Cryptomeria japonica TaxID=3369 RepID=UPI0024149F79|nr:G-type lectin S-receptor-like serine/threonine-protein kinase At2g19130 [Cryptomeria japonica]GLJ44806.1 hypothetical protein SUGI_0942390 [Cryptomeria japonica]
MDGKRATCCLSLFFAVTVFIHMKSYGAVVQAGDSLSLGSSLAGNQTLISKNGTFELGFFSPNGSNNWYIGIWFANVLEKTIVWVANRETPARNKSGVLKLSRQGKLKLFDSEGASIWSVNISSKASRAVILDSGNFLMLGDDNKADTVWQSFDNPLDTLLSGMRFGGQQKLVSWKNSLDPAPGLFSYHVDPSEAKQMVLTWNNSIQYWESGSWDGNVFNDIPEMVMEGLYNISIESTRSALYVSYKLITNINALSRVVLTKSGDYGQALYDGSKWNMFWSVPRDECAIYGLCGAYGTCNSNHLQFCSCVESFTPKDNRARDSQEWWSSGCVRQRPLNCSTDGFIDSNATLPNDYPSSFPAPTKKDCEKACLSNCSCTAYSFNPLSESCQIWSGHLLNMRSSPSKRNSNVFIRVAASALPNFDPPSSSRFKTILPVVLGIAIALTITLGIFSFLMWGRRYWLRPVESCADSSNSFFRMFSYKELKIATGNFRSMLGSGGFGSVFKGSLADGTLVAVKKLEGSNRDDKQFRAEISSLGNIQHANLIRLRGFCAEESRRLLVYDYMPNSSLNSLLFTSNSKSKTKVLDWKTRFQIALGTARALVYLHEECRDRIIHGDIKPENILLDANYSPKVADFGMAKLVSRDLSRILTTTRGTRGYLAPEWISGLPITPKVDVYSFGMTLLEIISGRRTLDLKVQDSSKYYFPTWAATQIYKGNTINIVEEDVAEEKDIEEVRRVTVVALLCIEKDEEVRPSMEQVVLMLEGKIEPQAPWISSSALMDKQANRNDSDGKSNGDVENAS